MNMRRRCEEKERRDQSEERKLSTCVTCNRCCHTGHRSHTWWCYMSKHMHTLTDLQDTRSHLSIMPCDLYICLSVQYICMLTWVNPDHLYNTIQQRFNWWTRRRLNDLITYLYGEILTRQSAHIGLNHHAAPHLFIINILPVNSREEAVSHYFFSVVWSSTKPRGEEWGMLIITQKNTENRRSNIWFEPAR